MSITEEVSNKQDETYQKIVDAVKTILYTLPQGTTFNLRNVRKTNDQNLTGLIIQTPNTNITPTIYLDDFVKKINAGEMTVEQAAETIAETYNANAVYTKFDIEKMFNRENLFCEVVNKNMNSEMLAGAPHEDIEDLSLIVRCKVSPEASYVVKNEHIGRFGLTPSELIDIAKQNTIHNGADVRSMSEIMAEIMGTNEPVMSMEEMPMLVISNQNKSFGATLPFISEDTRKQIYEKVGGEYFLIPSSIHECIAIPADKATAEDIQKMIGDVNSTSVRAEEVLSNQPYLVDSKLNLKLACEQAVKQAVQQTQQRQRTVHYR